MSFLRQKTYVTYSLDIRNNAMDRLIYEFLISSHGNHLYILGIGVNEKLAWANALGNFLISNTPPANKIRSVVVGKIDKNAKKRTTP